MVNRVDFLIVWIAVIEGAIVDFYSNNFDLSSESATWFFSDEYHNSFSKIASILGVDIVEVRERLLNNYSLKSFRKGYKLKVGESFSIKRYRR